MQTTKLNAETRTINGKGAMRRLRNGGKIPAVSYGKGIPTEQFAVSPKEIVAILASERGRNTVIELDIPGGRNRQVLLAEFQYHPVTRSLLHADFLEVQEDQQVDVDVPFEVTGKPKGVVAGGILRQVYRKLPLRCVPSKIPVKITHDVTELDIDDSVAAKLLTLPEGVTVRLPPEQTVVSVTTEKKRDEAEAPAPGAPGAAAAGAAAPAAGGTGGAAAAPAAGGKAGAAPAAAGKAGGGGKAGGKK
jgi:large subunit ribosomal protein L25